MILWFPGLQLYGVALSDTVHFDHVTNFSHLYSLLYGVALSDSVFGVSRTGQNIFLKRDISRSKHGYKNKQ